MKKHLAIAVALCIAITALSLASNFIRWDETPLEQSIFGLPLAIGLIIQIPFLAIMGLVIENGNASVNYELLWSIIPFLTGASYASLYYLVAKNFLEKRPQHCDCVA